MDWTVFVAEQWLLVSILGFLITALIVVEGRKGGSALSHHEVTRMINDDTAILVDLRDTKDFKAGHIAGAINIPALKLNNRMSELEKYKAKTIIVLDKMGQHSGAAGQSLKLKGFESKRLQGGMSDWISQNLPVIKS